jgi:hypothetical protein
MKIIFLDIDGVLNTECYINHFWEYCKLNDLARPEAKKDFNELMRDFYGNLFDPISVSALKYIVDQTGAKIIISSSWRGSGEEWCKMMWVERGLPSEVIGITPHMSRRHEDFSLPFLERLERGHEIADWLDHTNEAIDSYVIIDDDNDMLEGQLEYFVQTNPIYGLTFQDALKSVEILNKITK